MEELGVRERLAAAQQSLSRAELRVAERLLDGYPAGALGSLAQVAEESGVSAPTVLRMLAKLGFSGYPAFREQVRSEVVAMLGAGSGPEDSPSTELERTAKIFEHEVLGTLHGVDHDVFDQVVDLLADPRRRVLLTGGAFTGIAASHLARYLAIARRGVAEIPIDPRARAAALLDASQWTVLIAFDYRPLDDDTIGFIREILGSGATVVYVTDSAFSPAVDADIHILRVTSSGARPLPSMLGGFALSETLAIAVLERFGDVARERFRRFFASADRAFGLWRDVP